MALFFQIVGATLFALMLPILYRLIVGPTAIDRILAVNVIGTKTAVSLVIVGVIFGQVGMFVDFALAYALLNFVGSLAAARYFHQVRIRKGNLDPNVTSTEPSGS